MMLRHLFLGICICGVGLQPAAAQDTEPRVANTMTVGAEGAGVTRQFFGTVVARQTVDLGFQVSGQIVQMPAQEGQVIPAGDLVAELDLEPFELQLRQAQLQYEQAERTFNRLQQLGGNVSSAQLDDAETQLGLAGVSVRNAEVALENATLSAPFTALVAARNVANFSTIAQGTPVVRLHDMSELRVEIDVPEVLFQLSNGDDSIQLEARFPTGPETYPLEVREFNAEASSVGQSFRATLALPRDAGLTVLPGSSVTVLATQLDSDAPILIPSSALRLGNNGETHVMRYVPLDDDTGELEEVAVTIMPNRDGLVTITDGIAAGDEILRTGDQAVSDGQVDRRFSGFSQ